MCHLASHPTQVQVFLTFLYDFVDGLGEIFGIPVVWENSMLVYLDDGFRLKQQAVVI